MAFSGFNLRPDFALTDVARLHLLRRKSDMVWVPEEELEIRFVKPSARFSPCAWRSGLIGPGLSAEDLSLLERIRGEEEGKSAESPPHSLSRRLGGYVRGRALAAKDDAERRTVVSETLALLQVAARLLAADQNSDVLDFSLLAQNLPRLIVNPARSRAERERLERWAVKAFFLLEEEERGWQRATSDLERAQIETRDVLRVLPESGRFRADVKKSVTMVIGWSNERRFVAAARVKAGAELVIQIPWTGRRIQVVGNALGLTHVAALLRNSDAGRRRGESPAPSAAVNMPGRQAPEEAEKVFLLSESGMVAGNVWWVEPGAPRSSLSSRELLSLVLAALDPRWLPELMKAADPGSGLLTAENLSRATLVGL